MGDLHELTVSGQGGTLAYSQLATETVVLYAPQDLADEIARATGANSVELTVRDPHDAPTVADRARAVLIGIDPDVVFEDLLDVRSPGSWPGESDFDNFSTLFYVVAILALISAMVLISNTMTTIVAEQIREIAIMKAIGGRRRQIIRSFCRRSDCWPASALWPVHF